MNREEDSDPTVLLRRLEHGVYTFGEPKVPDILWAGKPCKQEAAVEVDRPTIVFPA